MYGCDCRRKNPQHWRDYDHPAEHEKLAGSKPLPEVVDLENEPDVDPSIVNLDHFETDIELAHRLQQQEQLSAETASAELARQLARQQQPQPPQPMQVEEQLRRDEELARRLAREQEEQAQPPRAKLQRTEQWAASHGGTAEAWEQVHLPAHERRSRELAGRAPPPRRVFDCRTVPGRQEWSLRA